MHSFKKNCFAEVTFCVFVLFLSKCPQLVLRPDLSKLPVFHSQQKEKVNNRQMEKASMEKANPRYQALEFKFQTIVKYLLMGSTYARAGRSDVAQQKPNPGRGAWLVIICVGRRDATRITRAMSAQSGTCKLWSKWISPLHTLWRIQFSPCNQ